VLPRVPVAGDWVEIPRYRTRVKRAQWSPDGRVIARLEEATVEINYLDELEHAGWQTFTRRGADEWLHELPTD
jgi:hypothetical protein